MIARYGTAASLGIPITLALLFVMQLLIATGGAGLAAPRVGNILDFVRVERNETVELNEDEIRPPPEPTVPPERTTLTNEDIGAGPLDVSIEAPDMGGVLAGRGIDFAASDGDYLPIVKVEPIYPASAARRALEGYVIVQFTVTRTGTTRDIHVTESSHTVFERAAIEAAGRFKYRPRVIDGQPVEVPGVANKFSFQLE